MEAKRTPLTGSAGHRRTIGRQEQSHILVFSRQVIEFDEGTRQIGTRKRLRLSTSGRRADGCAPCLLDRPTREGIFRCNEMHLA